MGIIQTKKKKGNLFKELIPFTLIKMSLNLWGKKMSWIWKEHKNTWNLYHKVYHLNNRILSWFLSFMTLLIWMTQKLCSIFIFNLEIEKKKESDQFFISYSCEKLSNILWKKRGRRVVTWDTNDRSGDCFFLLSWVQKNEYSPMPQIAIRIPIMFLSVKGSCSSV